MRLLASARLEFLQKNKETRGNYKRLNIKRLKNN